MKMRNKSNWIVLMILGVMQLMLISCSDDNLDKNDTHFEEYKDNKS